MPNISMNESRQRRFMFSGIVMNAGSILFKRHSLVLPHQAPALAWMSSSCSGIPFPQADGHENIVFPWRRFSMVNSLIQCPTK